jgi:hypothetical protein
MRNFDMETPLGTSSPESRSPPYMKPFTVGSVTWFFLEPLALAPANIGAEYRPLHLNKTPIALGSKRELYACLPNMIEMRKDGQRKGRLVETRKDFTISVNGGKEADNGKGRQRSSLPIVNGSSSIPGDVTSYRLVL